MSRLKDMKCPHCGHRNLALKLPCWLDKNKKFIKWDEESSYDVCFSGVASGFCCSELCGKDFFFTERLVTFKTEKEAKEEAGLAELKLPSGFQSMRLTYDIRHWSERCYKQRLEMLETLLGVKGVDESGCGHGVWVVETEESDLRKLLDLDNRIKAIIAGKDSKK